MYCKRCYAELRETANKCLSCKRPYDPADPATYLNRPFPEKWTVAKHIAYTTLIGVIVAYVVSFHQLAAYSGH